MPLATIFAAERAQQKKRQQDDYGILWRNDKPQDFGLEDPLQYVEVVNGTPEPDGTYKRYFLGADASIKTARAAVAATNLPPNMEMTQENVEAFYGAGAEKYKEAIRT